MVSIPKRVLEALNPLMNLCLKILKKVSIPKRVLEALNPVEFFGFKSCFQFQSLKGF